MWFGVLGAVEARSADGLVLAVGGPRVRAVLAMLALDAGRVVTAERLIDGLYGDEPPANAANALQSQISRLRHQLGRTGAVEGHPAGYRLPAEPQDVDAHRFEHLAEAGRRELAAGRAREAAALLREALGLWRGPAFADVGDAPFARGQAARLEELRLGAVEDRIEAGLALGAHRTLVGELRDLVAAHPLRERVRGQLMRALYGGGRQAEALAAYEETRRVLAEELGAEPGADLAALHLAMLRSEPLPPVPGSPPSVAGPPPEAEPRTGPDAGVTGAAVAEEPAGSAAGDTRAGLPAQLTSFVGRSQELERVGALLEEGRLVTLTGPGGAGKTRLAVEAAGRSPGEVYFADLAAVTDGAEVPQAVLGALGLRETGLAPPMPGRPVPGPVEKMIAALTGRRVLLVLDNCEHLVEAAAGLAARLLGACSTLRILATSREALGITGESLCPLSSLALPPAGTQAQEAPGYPAVRLFADRAAAVRPGFTLDETTAEAVVRICRALDGQPLAIELAAARLRSLTAEEVAARLDDRFRLLSRGSRAAQPRHRTLRAVVEWSWDLLEEDERVLARRLTVFAGGATLEAATAVCGLPGEDVVEWLTGLADKSLVEVTGDRYRMLETIRAFCAERLAEAGEQERMRRAHADHFLGLALAAGARLLGADQLRWLASLDAERDNLHAALRRATDAGDTERALRLLAALIPYLWMRGTRGEGTGPAEEIIRSIGTRIPAGLEEEYAMCVFSIVSGGSRGEFDEHLNSVIGSMVAAGRPPRQPFLTMLWGMAMGIPEPGVAASMKEERALIGQDPWSRALGLLGDGLMMVHAMRVEEGERALSAALEGFQAVGERWGLSLTQSELTKIAEWQGDTGRALALIEASMELSRELGADDDVAERLCRRALIRVRTGEAEGARRDAEQAMEIARRAGAAEVLAQAYQALGRIARAQGDADRARGLLEEGLAACPTGWFGFEETRAGIMIDLGFLCEAAGEGTAALAWYRQVLDIAVAHRNMTLAAAVAGALSGVALLEGDDERAALLLGTAAALRGTAVAPDAEAVRLESAARARLGDAAFEKAFGQGTSATGEQALAVLVSEDAGGR
ncbi:BTAD domain-containing putative transcriptional regulator [Planobispora siamensis]|uniref:SARP family transcriptional regulator n=1 Tax=Planobispora siamensis TaxID=936338 RepID=A0A8J3SBU9_9ACTN|nr:BTAD domain-containing putative transcriptional regulator [Planobispora siamensis]GIH90330.1 SARP family transcriptional regulator [Planobispora siamensis]